MSEGPEVHRIAAWLDEELVGSRVQGVTTNLRKARAWLEAHPGAVEGRAIRGVEACGKHILWRLEEDYYFHFHLLMFGKWELFPPGADVPYDPATRAHIHTTRRLVTLCRGQVFDIGQGDPYADLPSLAALGPDMCAVPFDDAEFRRRLGRPAHQDQEIAVVLLDQTVANGVGNYLKADILFECRLNPWLRVGDLTEADLACLARTIPLLGQRALAHRGWTLPDEWREGLESGAIPQERRSRHWVFRRTKPALPRVRHPHPPGQAGAGGGAVDFLVPRLPGAAPRRRRGVGRQHLAPGRLTLLLLRSRKNKITHVTQAAGSAPTAKRSSPVERTAPSAGGPCRYLSPRRTPRNSRHNPQQKGCCPWLTARRSHGTVRGRVSDR
jgi:formamidopyrimidine-DNA glycosylase